MHLKLEDDNIIIEGDVEAVVREQADTGNHSFELSPRYDAPVCFSGRFKGVYKITVKEHTASFELGTRAVSSDTLAEARKACQAPVGAKWFLDGSVVTFRWKKNSKTP